MAGEALRRWWGRYGLVAALTTLALGIPFALRQTQGNALVETYYWLAKWVHPAEDVRSENGVEPAVRARTSALHAQLDELERQNRQLRRLLNLRQTLGEAAVSAEVVGRSVDGWWQQLTVGRGTNDGIKVGDVLMAPGGLVGRIESVTPNTSRVLLVSDPTSRVGVLLSRSQSMGVLRGQGSDRAALVFFEREPDVKVGDTVVTSGLSSHYPPGVVVGKVQSVQLDASPAPEAKIELAAPLSHVEWGMVYAYDGSSAAIP
jgi:rod shape-determining protein MreC